MEPPVVLVPWLFSPADADVMPHARATVKKIEGTLGLEYLTLTNAAAASALGSQSPPHDIDQFLVHHDNLLRKAAVGRHGRLDCGLICRGGGSKVDDGNHCFLFDLLVEFLHGGIVGRILDRALGSLLQLAQFLMGNGEICFKMRPGIIGWVAAAPYFAVFGKHAGFEDEVVARGDHLLCRIRIVGGGRDVYGDVDLLNEDPHRLIHVIISAHSLVIFLKITIRNLRVSKVKLRQHLLGDDFGVSNVFVPEGLNVGFIDGRYEQ